MWWSWKNWFWTVSTLGGCSGRVAFKELIWTVFIWEGVVVIIQLISKSFYFVRVWWSWKNWFWTISTFWGCDHFETTDFEQFLLWAGVTVLKRTDFEQFLLCKGVMVLKELILKSFYFGRVWWSWKNWFWRVSTLGGCGGLERTDF